MTTATAPDVEAIITTLLRDDPGIIALVGDRVYSELPHTREYPLVLVTRVGGGYLINRPLWLDAAQVEIHAYGGSHRDAQVLLGTCLGVLAERLVRRHLAGAVTKFSVSATAYSPDSDSIDSQGHGRPRFIAETVVCVHP